MKNMESILVPKIFWDSMELSTERELKIFDISGLTLIVQMINVEIDEKCVCILKEGKNIIYANFTNNFNLILSAGTQKPIQLIGVDTFNFF